MNKTIILILLTVTFFVNSFSADFLEIRTVSKNLDTPWEILWGNDNHIWMTERFGRISRVNPETGELTVLATIDEVFENGERGLMGMTLHNDFQNFPYVYVVYNTGSNDANTRIKIVRFTYSNNELINPQTIIENIKGWWNHNGSRLWVDSDSKLWFTIGDAASPNLAQDLSNVNGKLCRINLDGTIPNDNPFPDSPIWSYGHRNQQGLVFANGKIYTSEHGASTDDEINLIVKGGNYGWPNVEGYCNTEEEKKFCLEKNVVEPIKSLTPDYTLAIAGLDYYNSGQIKEFNNSLLVVSLKAASITQLKLDDSGEKVIEMNEYFVNKFGRLRDLCISPDGRVFIATSNRDGRGSPATDDDRIIELKSKESSVYNTDNPNILISPIPVDENVIFDFGQNLLVNSIEILDIRGNIVNRFDNIAHQLIWNRTDSLGNILDAGLYFAIIKTEGSIFYKKIILK